ncbi:WD40 repeat domain-containing protein, partial [Mycobacterium kansasii]|uniref:WD40 repeat domain-containing protein n=1 Tax=Mycobacterium kansasii TaxID=1768 RepID=UPI00159BA48A
SADSTVRLWDAGTGQPIGAPLTGHTGAVASVAFSPDGRRIVSGSADSTVRLWDAGTGQRLRQRRQNAAVVGCRHRRADRRPADRPHRPGGKCGL